MEFQKKKEEKWIIFYTHLFVLFCVFVILLEIWYARLGRVDFVGGIDNEALDFGQLESFVHLPAINTSISNGNTTATTAAIILTAVSTTPTNTITTTATASEAATNTPAHGLCH